MPTEAPYYGLKQLGYWCLAWILLPNLLFLAVSVFAGGPPLYPQILLSGLVGLLVRRSRFKVQFLFFTAMIAWSSWCFLAGVFRLSIWSAVEWAPYLLDLQPFAAPEYLAFALAIAATLLAATKLLRRDIGFECGKCAAAAALAIASCAAADVALATASEGSYDRLASPDTPFTSGVKQSHFLQLADRKHHLVKVMVESMGLPTDPELRERLLRRWQQPDIRRLYDVQIGTTPFYGSTTHGEIRGLCGRWSDYSPFMTGYHSECLPAQLHAKGYETTGIHSFSGTFFDRARWYRNVGFEKELFRDDLLSAGATPCGGVFPAVCDREIPALLGRRLQSATKPQFLYWLTVNSHLPIIADRGLHTERCRGFTEAFNEEFPMTCRLFEVWEDLNEGLARMATDPKLPPTDFLISGDHAPPFLDRAERELFDGRRVPWILLKRKGTSGSRTARPIIAAAPPGGHLTRS